MPNFSVAFFSKLLHVNDQCMIKSCRFCLKSIIAAKFTVFPKIFVCFIKPHDMRVNKLFQLNCGHCYCAHFVFKCETCGLQVFPRIVFAKTLIALCWDINIQVHSMAAICASVMIHCVPKKSTF